MRKLLPRVLLVFAALTVTVVGSVFALSSRRINRTWDVPVVTISTSTDSATIAHGAHVARIRGCLDCHGEDLGGGVFADAMPVMRLTASNLTVGENGVGSTYTDEDWVRAIRSGVASDGSALLYMPSYEYRALGPEDLGALVSWIKSRPPVDAEPSEQVVGPLGRVLFLAGQLPLLPVEMIDHSESSFEQPEATVTVEFGAYLAASCVGCHGEGLSGGTIPGVPPEWPQAANITPDMETGIGGWTEEDFLRLAESGVRPDGRSIDPQYMPWPSIGAMTEDERRAVWLHLRSVPGAPEGNR